MECFGAEPPYAPCFTYSVFRRVQSVRRVVSPYPHDRLVVVGYTFLIVLEYSRSPKSKNNRFFVSNDRSH